MKREVLLPVFPSRIISLVPSQTELLYYLGLADRVVGITKFCIHPEEWFRSKTRVGGTKKLNFEKIRALQPDLIIGNKEENFKDDIEALEKEFPVWMSDIETFDQALQSIQQIGLITNKEQEVEVLLNEIKEKKQSFSMQNNQSVLYFIWRNPWMAVGGNTFIDEMLQVCGLNNQCKEDRYVELSEEQIRELNPELIYLSSEPFPFKEKHLAEMQKIAPNATIKLVDGEMFSWYGSRLAKAFDYFETIL